MLVSVITPSVRPEALDMVWKCLQKQTFPREDWEWLVGSSFEYKNADVWVKDPGKNEGDFYSLCKTYNLLIRQAKGQLVLSYQDGIWTQPDMLQHFWDLYQDNSMRCVGAVGDQYEKLDEFGKPTICCWQDPRKRRDHGDFYQCFPIDIEFTLCGIPKKAFFDVGGFDEVYDLGCAVAEKELVLRMDKLGYRPYLNQSLEYRALHHPRLTSDWDKYYKIACDLWDKHFGQVQRGERLKLNYL